MLDVMTFIVSEIIGACLIILAVVRLIQIRGHFNDSDDAKYIFGGFSIGVIILIIGIIVSMVYVVPANNVGVMYSIVSGTSDQTLNEGTGFKSPLDRVYLIDTTVQERTVDGVTVQSKDAQFLTMSVNVKFRVNKENAYTVFQRYTTIDNLKENVIGNYAQRAVESIITKYNVIDALGEQKNAIYSEAEETLSSMLKEEGVDLVSITIKDMDAGEAIEKAIQDEAVAKKAVETAQQEQQKAQIEAETKVIEAQGEADANAILTQQLTEEILQDKFIEKWDGELPIVYGADGQMIDISALME